MNIRMKGPLGMELTATNADLSLQKYCRDRIYTTWEQELSDFLNEVSVAIRKLQAGEKVTIASKPIEITIEKCTDEQEQPK